MSLRRSQRISLYHPSLVPLLSCRHLRHLLQVQSHLTVTDLLSDPFAASRLLKTSLNLSLPHSLLLFRHLPAADLFSLNLLLPHLPPLDSLRLLLHHRHSPPTSFSLTALLSSASRHRHLTAGELSHSLALKLGLAYSSVFVANALIHMYSACGLLSPARQLFDEMPERDITSWNSVVDAYCKAGDLASARELFSVMPASNAASWNVIIAGCLRGRRRTAMGLAFVTRAVEEGVVVNVRMLVEAVTGCGRMGRAREGRSVHGRFVRGVDDDDDNEGNLIFGTALVDMYGKCRRIVDARKVFDGLREMGRNLVCWNAMIVGYCVHGEARDGIVLFEVMIGEGNNFVYSCL